MMPNGMLLRQWHGQQADAATSILPRSAYIIIDQLTVYSLNFHYAGFRQFWPNWVTIQNGIFSHEKASQSALSNFEVGTALRIRDPIPGSI